MYGAFLPKKPKRALVLGSVLIELTVERPEPPRKVGVLGGRPVRLVIPGHRASVAEET